MTGFKYEKTLSLIESSLRIIFKWPTMGKCILIKAFAFVLRSGYVASCKVYPYCIQYSLKIHILFVFWSRAGISENAVLYFNGWSTRDSTTAKLLAHRMTLRKHSRWKRTTLVEIRRIVEVKEQSRSVGHNDGTLVAEPLHCGHAPNNRLWRRQFKVHTVYSYFISLIRLRL